MPKELTVALLGTPQIMLDEVPLHERLARKEQALLAYVAMNAKVHQRTTIATLFWGNDADKRALSNLRDLLPNLRRQCGTHLTITHRTIAFNRLAPYSLDVEDFQRGLQEEAPFDPIARRATLGLYRGEFLADLLVRDAPEFEHWLLLQRQQLKLLTEQGWQRLLDYYIAQGDIALGVSAAKQLLEFEPWQESVHQQYMLLLARSGQRSNALAHYAVLQRTLATELDIAPNAESRAIYEQIKAGVFDPHAESTIELQDDRRQPHLQELNEAQAAPAVEEPQTILPHRALSAPQSTADIPNLYANWSAIPDLKKFYGRHYELAHLESWLIEEQTRAGGYSGYGWTGKDQLGC